MADGPGRQDLALEITMSKRDETRTHPHAMAHPLGTLGKRVRNMTLLWLGFGALVGAGTAPPGAGTIGILSGAIAGMLVLPLLGTALGLMGGQLRETLAGGLCGLAVGTAVAALRTEAPWQFGADFGLLVGGLAGATFPGLCLLLRRQLSWLIPV
jgi:hypothetical protein